jgi:nucleoid-associated protein YgaU
MGIFDFLKKGTQRPTAGDAKARQPSTTRSAADRLNPGPGPAKQGPANQGTSRPVAETSNSMFDKPGGAVKAPVTEQPQVSQELYTVKSGDSLSKIAKLKYNDAQQWRKIYEANKAQIKNPDLIHPGQKLIIPR